VEVGAEWFGEVKGQLVAISPHAKVKIRYQESTVKKFRNQMRGKGAE